ARDVVLGILPHAFPYAHHVAARRVHEFTPLFFEFAPRGNFSTESWNNDYVVPAQQVHFFFGRFVGDGLDPQITNLVVDFRVMNNLPQEENSSIRRKRLTRRVGEINRAFDAVTIAEFLRELDGQTMRG